MPRSACTPAERARLTAGRLWAHGLAEPRFETATAVVHWMGAVQAQDPRQAAWAVGARMKEPRLDAVERALEERAVVWTWPMRGTLHWVAAEDVHWMLALTATRVLGAAASQRRRLGLDDEALARAAAVFRRLLSGGRRAFRDDMLEALADAGVDPSGQRGYHVLRDLAMEGLLCLGPRDGARQTFVLLDEWVPEPSRLEPERPLAELARRYFTSHGPATAHDFAWWSGLTVRQAREGIAAAGGGLACVRIAGTEHWSAPDAPPVGGGRRAPLLLPGFDEYLLGYRDRTAVLDEAHAPFVTPGRNGIFRPVVAVRGRIAGTWASSVSGGALEVGVVPFTEGAVPARRHWSAAKRLAAFRGHALGGVSVEAPRSAGG